MQFCILFVQQQNSSHIWNSLICWSLNGLSATCFHHQYSCNFQLKIFSFIIAEMYWWVNLFNHNFITQGIKSFRMNYIKLLTCHQNVMWRYKWFSLFKHWFTLRNYPGTLFGGWQVYLRNCNKWKLISWWI